MIEQSMETFHRDWQGSTLSGLALFLAQQTNEQKEQAV